MFTTTTAPTPHRTVHHRKMETCCGDATYLYCTAVYAVYTPSAHVKMLSLSGSIQQLLYIINVPSWQLLLRPYMIRDVCTTVVEKKIKYMVSEYIYIHIGTRTKTYILYNIYLYTIYYCTDEHKQASALRRVTIKILCMIFITCCVHHNIIYLFHI